MSVVKDLEHRINDREATIAVIGMGYVGLPLALAFNDAGFNVIGLDADQRRVGKLVSGESYLVDISTAQLTKALKTGKFLATSSSYHLLKADVVIICVPTPLNETRDPDMRFIENASKDIMQHLHRGQIIILESTTYPGTTREVVKPILEQSGATCGQDFLLAFSPERINPGSDKFNIKNTPKVVGGIDKDALAIAALLYGQVADNIVEVSCPEVAEMGKIYENTFRNVNIALVNEMARLCRVMNLSIWEVIKTASSKPFGFMPFYPGAGVGGHCTPLDPYYLSHKARQFGFHTRFIELAAEINESMPEYTVDQVAWALDSRLKSVRNARILILGVAYKKDIGDVRESPALRVIQLLQERGASIHYNDPYIPDLKAEGIDLCSHELINDLGWYDCVVIITAHSSFDLPKIVKNASLVFDTNGCTVGIESENIVRLGEGK
jgi:UDP-N-acetyl-D-glucosamine dehydrogenase